ncbi:MAG: hypothetical protein SFW67_24005 [Myxococcaceae bacterium]|nr:hypothetical protein [Myxococcaceae bacterium]
MFLVALALASSTLSAAPPPLVTLSRRSGVSAPRALAVVEEVADALVGLPPGRPVSDLTACRAKQACLLTAARQAGATVLVTVKVSSVLDEGALEVEAWSIDDDGARVAQVLVEGPLAGLVAKARPTLSGSFSERLRTTLGLVPPTPPRPDPAVTPPPVVQADAAPERPRPPTAQGTDVARAPPTPTQPQPAPVVTAARGPSAVRVSGLVVAGAGAAALVAAALSAAVAADASAKSVARCAPQTPCADVTAFGDYLRAAHAQNAAVALTVSGAAAVALGALLFFLDPGQRPPVVSVTPSPGGATVGVMTTW